VHAVAGGTNGCDVIARYLLAAAFSVVLVGAALARGEPLMVITSKPHASLPQATLRAIFAMRMRQWPDDGSPITVFVLQPSDPLHAEFCKTVLDVFPYQLQRVWDRLVYSGTGQAPIELSSLEEMRKRIASTPGAIGYLSTDRIDDNLYPVQVR
jgi:ABC-type phosphate transport system substrate-binding protein